MTEHVIETITPSATGAGVAVFLLIDCSCGAEIASADDADAVEDAFREHVPGAWAIARDKRQPRSLAGSRLVPAREEMPR